MEHLSQQQIVAFIDGRLEDAEQQICKAHLTGCERCRNEIVLQRSLESVVHHLPLEKTSLRFTERTMNRILRRSTQSLSYKILQHVGSAVAMIAVLVVLGYILSSPSDLLSGADDSTSSELFTAWQTFYSNFKALLSQGTEKLGMSVVTQSSTPASKVVAIAFAVFIGLAALDRFVFQKVSGTRM